MDKSCSFNAKKPSFCGEMCKSKNIKTRETKYEPDLTDPRTNKNQKLYYSSQKSIFNFLNFSLE
jgi:hypothetical protein